MQRDPSDHTRAFDPKTGQNFAYDKDKQAWIDVKTGECICPKCPPVTEKAEKERAEPPPPTSTFGSRLLKGAYLEGFMGVGFYGSSSFCPTFNESQAGGGDLFSRSGSKSFPGTMAPSFTGGLKVGHWGCPLSDEPAWDYFGWNLDLGYQRYAVRRQPGTFQQTFRVNGFPSLSETGEADLYGTGSLFTLGLLVNARYGFLPTPEVPFGTLQPYVGVGPTVMFSSFSPTVQFTRLTSLNGIPVNLPLNGTSKFGSNSNVSVGLSAEAGLRYFPLPHVFLDLGFRYTYGQPSFSYTQGNLRLNFDNTVNNYRITAGVGYQW